MPDLFGKKQLGRASNGGRFYATPSERVEAGAVYFPDESSLLFGVAEYTVEAGNLGAFATEGTFFFERPDDWLDSLGRKVFYRPSTGEIVNQDKKGDVLIGFQVFANVPDDKLGVVLTQGENSVVIIVTSTADSGAGSLRQAIADAQDGDVILFDPDVFPAGQTTSILLSSYITVNKSVSIYGGSSDGNGGYTSGATITRYVVREVDGIETEVVVDDDHPAQEGETVLLHVTTRVALDGQATQDPDAEDEWSGWTGSRVFYNLSRSSASDVIETTVSGLTFQNGLSTASEYSAVWCMSVAAMGLRTRFEDCKIANCINSSGIAGAITLRSLSESNYTFTRCEFRDCKAKGSAGGIYTRDNSSSSFNSCVITNCTAANYGGAVYSASTSQNTLTDCTISNCSATNGGGGLYSASTSQNTLTDCTISNCSASNGGGFFFTSTSQNTLTGCVINGCSASNGGGVYSVSSSQNTLNNCTITNCSATNSGGGVCLTATSQNTLNNCNITSCVSVNDGAGAYLSSTGLTTLNTCDIINNSVSDINIPSNSVVRINGVTICGKLKANANASVTIADGAALTITTSASIGAATFTSDGRGYLAVAAGIDASAATLTNVVLCAYGAGLESFEISADGAAWTADDLTTPILLEQKGDGNVWTTLDDDATGGSYSDTFTIGTTLRAFDGVRFFVASLDAYWQVESFVVASNGGGGAGDVSPSWTISDATITPNAEEV